jgi:hypothetical protein
MGNRRGGHSVLRVRPDGKRPLGRTVRRWEVNITMYLQEVLRRLTRKSKLERIKNKHIKEIMEVKEKPDIIDIIERKRLQWYGHVKRMQEERLPN